MTQTDVMFSKDNVVGVVLAGGQGRRMGYADKPLITLAGKTLLEHVVQRVGPQCANLLINANGDPKRFQQCDLPVVADGMADNPGPLAGILAGLDWVALRHPRATHIVSVPVDVPFIPFDLVKNLVRALGNNHVLARAFSSGRAHPVVGLWPIEIRSELRHQLVHHDIRKIDHFTSAFSMADVNFDGIPDPFFNVNTPKDRDEAEQILLRRE